MKRAEALKSIVHLFQDIPCCLTGGDGQVAWDSMRPSERSFHLKTLGSGSSIGLGLALALPHRKIVVLDGDGAVTMNINGLVTVGRMRPKNLIHMVFDNRVYEASGSVPTATSFNLDLVKVASGAGIESAARVSDLQDFTDAVVRALNTDGPHFILAEVEPMQAAGPVREASIWMPSISTSGIRRVGDVQGRYKFVEFLEQLEGRKISEDAIDVRNSISQ